MDQSKDNQPIFVELKPAGIPGGKRGIQLSNKPEYIPDGCRIFLNGGVLIHPDVTKEQLAAMAQNSGKYNNKNLKHFLHNWIAMQLYF